MNKGLLWGIVFIAILSLGLNIHQQNNIVKLNIKTYFLTIDNYNLKTKLSTIENKDYSEIYSKIKELEIAPDCNCNSKSYCYLYEDSQFNLILKNNANEIPYILNKYDCTEFSNELMARLNNAGFKAQTKLTHIDCDLWTDDWDYLKETTKYGYEDCLKNNLHQIVKVREIYIEAVNGEVVMPHEYIKYGLK